MSKDLYQSHRDSKRPLSRAFSFKEGKLSERCTCNSLITPLTSGNVPLDFLGSDQRDMQEAAFERAYQGTPNT